MDPTSPNRQSQQPHFKQSSCQYKSKAFSKNRSVIRLQHPAHSRKPIAVLLLPLLLLPPINDVFCVADIAALVTPVGIVDDAVDRVDDSDDDDDDDSVVFDDNSTDVADDDTTVAVDD